MTAKRGKASGRKAPREPQAEHAAPLKAGDAVSGFEVVSVDSLSDLGITAVLMRHARTGARMLHLAADDDENLFSISFPTPPTDDTGVPHIVEHSVLSGSGKYPVRDPFFEMVKMSMATFINAMTSHDFTCYPVSSNVKKDLFNLADVYFDAVFKPLLTRDTFKREAHHLCPALPGKPDGGLSVKGVVYSEMKGIYSNPEWKLQYTVARHLLPDSTYGYDSGGMPDMIRGLSYESFRDFYRRHYTPSNALFVVYGNVPTREYASFVDGRLAGIRDPGLPAPRIVRQARWTEPRTAADTYCIGRDETTDAKTYVAVNWLAGDASDLADSVSLHILGLILEGNEAAPLRKAIVDSRLGQDSFLLGEYAVGAECVFSAGIKGAEPEKAAEFEKLVLDTLREIADRPIPADAVEAAFQQAAYHQQEILSGFPIHMLSRVMAAWPYGKNPLMYLRTREYLAVCRAEYERDNRLFNRLIRDRLLDNPHRLTVVLKPDPGLQDRIDAAFNADMAALRASLRPAEMRKIAREAASLDRSSARPNPPAAVARLPQLSISDLPGKPRHIPTTTVRLETGGELLVNEVVSNGVNYLYVDFDLTGLPRGLWQCLPAYCDTVQKLGADGMDYQEVARRVAMRTGGISCGHYLLSNVTAGRAPVRRLRVAMKTLDGTMPGALDIMRRIIFGTDPRDGARMRDVAAQSFADWRTRLVHSGASTAGFRAARTLSENAYLADICWGLPQLPLAKSLVEKFDERFDGLVADIEAIRGFILARGRMTASFTGSAGGAESARQALTAWGMAMRGDKITPAPTGYARGARPARDGLAAPIQVSHCARIMPAPHISHGDSPFISIGAHIAGMDYMLPEIRFKGNAYGAWCRYDNLGGAISLGSYSDPHVVETLAVFDGLMQFVRKAKWTSTDIHRAIIALSKNDEKPIRPEDATATALIRRLTLQTPQWREQRRAMLLSATPKRVRAAFMDALEAGMPRAGTCVVSGRRNLEEANARLKGAKLEITDVEQGGTEQ